LNIGCGRRRLDGYKGVDMFPDPAVDTVWDLTKIPWPFENESVESVVTWHFLEHLPGYSLHNAMSEIHRILKVGGELYIKVPYMESPIFNPNHMRSFDRGSFNTWIVDEKNEDACLQSNQYFIRREQKVVYAPSGFPGWHITHRRRFDKFWKLFYNVDGFTKYPKVPSIYKGSRELREWLVKV
jgi:SAM-dependent methyltransferase